MTGADFLFALRSRHLSVPDLVVRLDTDEDQQAPSWWLERGYSAGDWWLYEPEILIRKNEPIYRLDLKALTGMSVTLVQHGESDERFSQLIDRLFVFGVESVLAVGDSVMVVTDGGRKIAA